MKNEEMKCQEEGEPMGKKCPLCGQELRNGRTISGSYDWKLNANEIVTQALLNINAIAVEETPTNDEMVDGRRSLNGMIKSWQAEGVLYTWPEPAGGR